MKPALLLLSVMLVVASFFLGRYVGHREAVSVYVNGKFVANAVSVNGTTVTLDRPFPDPIVGQQFTCGGPK